MNLALDAPYEVNGQFIISETIDNETVIINLETGSYYSLKHAGPTIWALLGRPVTLATVVAAVEAEFEVDAELARQGVEALIARLLEEGLIRRAEPRITAATADERPAQANGAVRRAFVAPTLDKFTDLEAMLLLDPIHDVDETGWPQLPGSAHLDAQ